MSSLAALETQQKFSPWRPYLWDAAIALFLEHPINGVGIRAFGVSSETLLVGYGVADRIPGAAYNWSPHLSVLEGGSRPGYYRLVGVRHTADHAGSLVDQRTDVSDRPRGLTALMALFPLGSTLPLFSARVSAVAWLSIAARVGICENSDPQSAAVIDRDVPQRDGPINHTIPKGIATVVCVELVAAYY